MEGDEQVAGKERQRWQDRTQYMERWGMEVGQKGSKEHQRHVDREDQGREEGMDRQSEREKKERAGEEQGKRPAWRRGLEGREGRGRTPKPGQSKVRGAVVGKAGGNGNEMG